MTQKPLSLDEDETVEVAILHVTNFYDLRREPVTIAKALGEDKIPWVTLPKDDYQLLVRNIHSVYAPGINGQGGQLVLVRRLDLVPKNESNYKDIASVIEACQKNEAYRIKLERETEAATAARQKRLKEEEERKKVLALKREKTKIKRLLKTNPELIEEAKAELQGALDSKPRTRKAAT